ncbi:fibronectin type III domain-containing protein, partial [Parvimonas sp. D9]|uniref:fibronectin type III domain-containing protein n=3 Tax=Parvimonas TaxID=543311 RepID=UPI002B471C80
ANPSTTWTVPGVAARNQVTYIMGLQPATQYSIRATATDGSRYSPASPWQTASTNGIANVSKDTQAVGGKPAATVINDINAAFQKAADAESTSNAALASAATVQSNLTSTAAEIRNELSAAQGS